MIFWSKVKKRFLNNFNFKFFVIIKWNLIFDKKNCTQVSLEDIPKQTKKSKLLWKYFKLFILLDNKARLIPHEQKPLTLYSLPYHNLPLSSSSSVRNLNSNPPQLEKKKATQKKEAKKGV